MNFSEINPDFFACLKQKIQEWGAEEGFQQIGISDTNLSSEDKSFREWIDKKYHGEMKWMEENQEKRLDPKALLPGTLRIISARMNYLPPNTQQIKVLKSPDKAYISRYALGRDYHKLIRKKLAKIAKKIENEVAIKLTQEESKSTNKASSSGVVQRAFVDSAPVLERPIAAKAGLGWTGKHTLLIEKETGSWFFLGEIFTNLPLPLDNVQHENKCGDCTACLKVCPTDAFPKPYQLDAKRCISYLTIENKNRIPEEFREAIGNRVFGCDDCQAICPWNKYAKHTNETDFLPRHGLADSDLLTLFLWSEKTFLQNTEGSAIRRIGYDAWQRNLAVGLGNANKSEDIKNVLGSRLEHSSPLVQEHIIWALERQKSKRPRKRKITKK